MMTINNKHLKKDLLACLYTLNSACQQADRLAIYGYWDGFSHSMTPNLSFKTRIFYVLQGGANNKFQPLRAEINFYAFKHFFILHYLNLRKSDYTGLKI